MKLLQNRERRRARFDMTPMIDVVFQLIIFFMLTSRFGALAPAPVDLAEQAGERTPSEAMPDLVIDLAADGSLTIENRPLDLARVARIARDQLDRAESAGRRLDLLVRPDKDCPAAQLDALANALLEAGVRRWKLGVANPVGPNAGAAP